MIIIDQSLKIQTKINSKRHCSTKNILNTKTSQSLVKITN